MHTAAVAASLRAMPCGRTRHLVLEPNDAACRVPWRSARLSGPCNRQPPRAHEVRVFPARLAVAKFFTVECSYRSAGGLQHRLRRARIPLHGAAEAWIQIGNPLRQTAELHARPEIDQLRHALVAEKVV